MSFILTDPHSFLGQLVNVAIDRPLGAPHPQHGFIYPLNYGFVTGTMAADAEELDAYVLGVLTAVSTYRGRCVAIIHRLDDDDDKLVIVPEGSRYNDDQIRALTAFQEQFFRSEIWRRR